MKGKIILLMLLVSQTISAQLTITPGARLSVAGNIQLTLQNMDLINNGNFTAGINMVSFSGNASSSISGSQPIQFSEIEINKTNNNVVRLQRAIGVSDRVLFTSGFLDLNGFNTDLGNSGRLEGEAETTRVIGSNGGEVLFTANLNSPTGSNPANLGILITTGQNLGAVTIRRGHQSQTTIPGSVLRYYDILPANNTNLNATLRFKYFNAELNGFDESLLEFFSSNNAVNWSSLGLTSKDTAVNFAEKIGIVSFSRFTLSGAVNSPLPVRFTSFHVTCEANKVAIEWKTAQEQNSDHFNIEKTTDGTRWTVIGNLPAAGNSNTEKSYSYTDNSPVQNSYYRIAQYDMNGRALYSGVLRLSCNMPDMFIIWPNPSHDMVYINIISDNASAVVIKMFDNKGSLVKVQKATLVPGSNQLMMDIGRLTNGIYSLYAEWNNGQVKKTSRLYKQ